MSFYAYGYAIYMLAAMPFLPAMHYYSNARLVHIASFDIFWRFSWHIELTIIYYIKLSFILRALMRRPGITYNFIWKL